MALTYEPFDTITVSKVNEKLGGGVEKLNQEFNGYLPLNGGTLTGDLNLNANSLYLNTNGYQINSFSGCLQIKQATDLTPNSVAIIEYNNNENKQLHFVVNDSSDGSHNTQVVLKKNVLQLYNNIISNGSTTTGYVNIKGVADGIDTHDAVNLGQLNKLAGGRVKIYTVAITGSTTQLFHNATTSTYYYLYSGSATFTDSTDMKSFISGNLANPNQRWSELTPIQIRNISFNSIAISFITTQSYDSAEAIPVYLYAIE